MRNTPLATLTGAVAPLLLADIDTDAIAPSRVKMGVDASGLSGLLFREWRFDADGAELPDFVLNRPERRTAVFVVALDYFGCGSSSETAPWAIRDYGIRCVVAPSFGSIFNANCYRNGVAPVVLARELVEELGHAAENAGGLTACARAKVDPRASVRRPAPAMPRSRLRRSQIAYMPLRPEHRLGWRLLSNAATALPPRSRLSGSNHRSQAPES